MKNLLTTLSSIVIAIAGSPSADASVLIFKSDVGGGLGSDVAVPAGYGDNIGAAVQGGFSYGATGGFTPNILVSYSGESLYNSDYGDLESVLYTFQPTLTITFTATVGTVTLTSFDMAAFVGSGDQTIPSITVSSENGTYSQPSLVAPVTGHSTVNFSGGLSAATGTTVTLTITGAQSGNGGFSNFQFSQDPPPAGDVPLVITNYNFNFDTDELTLTWGSTDTKSYRVTTSTNLLAPWLPVATGIPGAPALNETSTTVGFTQGAKGFFRVEEE